MRKFFLSLVVSIGLIAALLLPAAGLAQSGPGGWSTPVNLSNSETMSDAPSLAVDPAGGVHVVWTEATDDNRSFIAYAHLVDGNWSQANEIVASPDTQVADYPSLAADSRGYLHLAWRGDATLYYSQAYASLAGQAQGWSEPAALEFRQDYIGRPYLTVDAEDALYLAYAISVGEGSGIFMMKSTDHGKNWSDPFTIFQNQRSDRMTDAVRLAVGADGTVHAVWVEYNYPETFPPIGIRYAHSHDGGQTWSELQSLADGPYGFPSILIREPNEVHVVYSGAQPDRYKFHRWSADGGQTWSEVFRNTDAGGFQGLPSLAVDSAGVLHWLTTASVFSIGVDGLYHAAWQDGAWGAGEVVLRGEPVSQNPWDVSAAVALGNQLHVVVQYPIASNFQPDGWQDEIYYLRLDLDSPELPADPLSTPTVSLPTPSPTSPVIIETPRPTLEAPLTAQPNAGSSSMFDVLLLSMGGALAIVIAVILVVRRRR